jgi:hypothetical protein
LWPPTAKLASQGRHLDRFDEVALNVATLRQRPRARCGGQRRDLPAPNLHASINAAVASSMSKASIMNDFRPG